MMRAPFTNTFTQILVLATLSTSNGAEDGSLRTFGWRERARSVTEFSKEQVRPLRRRLARMPGS